MYIGTVISLAILGQVSISGGVPLERADTDVSQFFSNRIVGGQDAAQGQFPHMVALVVGGQITSLVCGGSLVTQRHVLTAAHCITSFVHWITGELLESFKAVVGSNRWQDGLVVTFEAHSIHAEYNSWTIKNDIGLLTTQNEVPLSENVTPIGLNFNWVGGGEKVVAAGWGTQQLGGEAAELLQHLSLNTTTPEQCEKMISDVIENTGGMSPPVDPKVEICTFHSTGHGMCHGDSGSALVLIKIKLQCGIVSWGFPCARGAPDVYVRVSGFKNWILSRIGGYLLK